MRRVRLAPVVLLCVGSLPGCAAMPFFGELFTRALASPDGIQAKTGSGKNVHCQTGESGRTDCVEYRTGGPLRPGAPGPTGSDPNAAPGENANASAVPAPVAVSVEPPAGWQAPMPLPPAPIR
jgi:hypothetical protein